MKKLFRNQPRLFFLVRQTNVSTCLVYRNALIMLHLSSLFDLCRMLFESKLTKLNHFLSFCFIGYHYSIFAQRGQGVDTDHQIPPDFISSHITPYYLIIATVRNQVKENHLIISYFILSCIHALTKAQKYDIISNN